MDMKAEIAARTKQIEAVIGKYLPEEEGLQARVISAMNYSVLAGGKRLRPMLMWETYRMFGGRSKVIEPFLAAIEMIHTYSLVHDDLPAMDNDEYRRGKKTTHAQYGEAMGILAGDGELKYFYPNYKDYYYLPTEDMAVHKSVASYVDKNFRIQAAAATCYVKKPGCFLPQYQELFSPALKQKYQDKTSYFELTEAFTNSKENLKTYAMHLLPALCIDKKHIGAPFLTNMTHGISHINFYFQPKQGAARK